MYVLDTNVISELRKANSGKADKNVVRWANSVSATSLFLSVITIMELEMGMLLVDRRDAAHGALLRSWLNNHVLPSFADRILVIDTTVALCCAKMHIPNPCSERDALIAATALTHGMTVVTRNLIDFASINIDVFDPWKFKNN